MNDKKIRGVLCALIGGICWGFSGCCGQYLFTEKSIDSTWLSAIRLIISGIILILISLLTQRENLIGALKTRSELLRILSFGLFGMMMCQLSYMKAIDYTNAATATVIQYTGPVLVMAVVCITQRKLPTKAEGLSLVLAVFGTYIIATHLDPTSLVISPKGLFWCILAALSVVTYTLIPQKITAKRSAPVVSGIGMLFGGVILSLIIRVWSYSVSLDIPALLCMASIIIIGTVIAFSIYLQAVSDIGPVKASIIASIEPVSSAVISYFWLGSKFEIIDYVGFTLILLTVPLLSVKDKSKINDKKEREAQS